MQLHSLTVERFLRLSYAHVQLDGSRAHLFWGRNEAGKSSLAEAVRFVVRGANPRVKFKKDYGQLLHAGSKSGSCALAFADPDGKGYTVTRTLPDGKTEGVALPGALTANNEAVAIALGETTLMAMDDAARRKFLFDLCGVSLSVDKICERLVQKGIDKSMVESCKPLLRAGFESAEKQAKQEKSLATGAWQEVTGEKYGSTKGETWQKQTRVAPPAADLEAAAGAAATAVKEHERSLKDLGAAKARAERIDRLGGADGIAQMRALVATEDEVAARIVPDFDLSQALEAELFKITTEIATLGRERTKLLTEVKTGEVPKCPACDVYLRVDASGKIVLAAGDGDSQHAAEEETKKAVKKIDDKVAELTTKKDDITKRKNDALAKVAVGKAEVDEIVKVRWKLEDLGADAEPPNVAALEISVSRLSAERDRLGNDYMALAEVAKEAEEGEAASLRAADLHRKIVGWTALAEQFGSDGIQSELLSEALAPFNAMLVAYSFGRMVEPVITREISVERDTIPYHLLSESARWRVDAVLAYVIAKKAGIPIVVLDRMDVLDLDNRQAFAHWLQDAAEEDGPMVLCMATLKGAPALESVKVWNVLDGKIA